jgi:hypothetical protein
MEHSYLAVWGAILSTILALIKIWEVYQGRFRIEITPSLSSPERGNTFTVTNLSKNQININYYKLFWAKKLSDSDSYQFLDTGIEEEGCNIKIPAHSNCVLKFHDQYYFSWGQQMQKKGNLYISLSLAAGQTQ